MSGPIQNVGSTLTGGIQDVSAILPLLGTNQCEHHVGSALEGGFLYAAAAPLSIFGSLGIVQVGFYVLVSIISIPKLSTSSRRILPINISQRRWLGAKTLKNAGFNPTGTVAALIAFDKNRYKAETQLIQILEEKHIDNPKNLSIKWKSRKWNIMLVLSTMVAAVISGTPYIDLVLRNSQSSLVHTSWIFPLLRTIGSCLAAVCSQFLIQSRVISLMKNRIVFMAMNCDLTDDLKSKHDDLEWDVDLPAEQCLRSLEQFLSSQSLSTQTRDGPNKPANHVSITVENPSFSNHEDIRKAFQQLCKKHFSNLALDRAYFLISWIVLFLSLPATVAGYIGCFTLVNNSEGNAPLIWLGLEATLSVVRILVWAWNPRWDEDKITVDIQLMQDQPFVTTEKAIEVIESNGQNTLTLVSEPRFLEWITPYTGPLEQFQCPVNLALYFTLTATGLKYKRLYMTVFDFKRQIALTLHRDTEKEGFIYVDADVAYNRIASAMEARLQSAIGEKHPRRINEFILFNKLAKYYEYMIHALNPKDRIETLPFQLKWNLDLPKDPPFDKQSSNQEMNAPSQNDLLYLDRGYEHHLKTNLIERWSKWIVVDMNTIRSDAQNDCHHALADKTSEKAKWELTELDLQLAWEWTRRELSLVLSSIKLEVILERRMKECINEILKKPGSGIGKEWLCSQFVIEQRKRLEQERKETRERMEKGMKDASDCAAREGRVWEDRSMFAPRWNEGLKFIDDQWSAGIEARNSELDKAVSQLDMLVQQKYGLLIPDERETRDPFVEQVSQRFKHWSPQRENERDEMDATIERISCGGGEHPADDYQYPDPVRDATCRFVQLRDDESVAKVCSATVYDVQGCDKSLIFNVIKKNTTRSVINVDQDLLNSIPENDHLLYIGSNHGKEPAFIQRNRERWWAQQTSNSSTFYLSPQAAGRQCVVRWEATIAHIFIFLRTPSRLRVRLLHGRSNASVSVSIQENGTELHCISTKEIPKEKLRLKDLELNQFEPGRHELELVVTGQGAHYGLRDILIEFFNDSDP